MSIKLLKKSIELVEDSAMPSKIKVRKDSVTNRASTRGKGKHFEKYVKKDTTYIKSPNEKIERNVKQLLQLSEPVITLKNIEKIVQHCQKAPTTTYSNKEESIFTDEDFQRFEQEYFIS